MSQTSLEIREGLIDKNCSQLAFLTTQDRDDARHEHR